MVKFAINTVGHENAIHPAEFGIWAEEHDFSRLYYGEHAHFPVASTLPAGMFPDGMPKWYKEFYDPMVSLSSVSAVTKSIQLGLAVCLVAQHHPIQLAKRLATLDRMSDGRVIFGIGGGWNREELADFGVEFGFHWGVIRESVEAIRELWSSEQAEYHGKHVNFDPAWCWPKPIKKSGPPVIMGGGGPATPRRIARYCDGWIPLDGGHEIEKLLAQTALEMEKVGRSMDELDLTVIVGYATPANEKRMEELLLMGFSTICFYVPPEPPADQWRSLQGCKDIMENFLGRA